MKVYVQSRGELQDFDYTWKDEVPDIEGFRDLKNLLRTSLFSLALGRYKSKLLLLVEGIKSDRKDFRQRVINNSIFLVGESNDTEDEKKIRLIAIAALRDELEEKLNQAIYSDREFGFKYDESKIVELSIGGNVKNGSAEQDCKLARYSDEMRRKLASELEQSTLPLGEGPLVIVTGNRSEKALKEARVWRGLSKLVEYDHWEPITDGSTGRPVFFMIAIVLTVVAIAVIILLMLNIPEDTTQPSEPIENQSETILENNNLQENDQEQTSYSKLNS